MEPIFTKPELSRYTQRSFPPYRFLPFRPDIPHPRNDPQGHSYGEEDEYLSSFTEADWHDCEPYLYGVDLFNHGYWWEAHEAWETVWLAAGRETQEGKFVQGLIQLAGAQLKRFTAVPRGAHQLTESGVAKLAVAKGVYLGIEVALLMTEIRRCLEEDAGVYPRIELQFSNSPKIPYE